MFLPLLALAGCGGVDFSSVNPDGTSREAMPTVRVNAQQNKGGTVIVQKGDSVYAIARRVGVPVRALIEANRLKPPYLLYVGRKLYIPRIHSHTVIKGDTLHKVARQYDVNVYELARQNDLRSPYTIRIGQTLRLPGVEKTIVEKVVSAVKSGTKSSATTKQAPRTTSKSRPVPRKRVASVPTPPKASGKGFAWPVRGRVISNFGAKDKGLHNDGINILAPKGTPVRAVENGVVAYAGNELRGFGNLLLIKHSGGWITAYAHNDSLLVKRGDKVGKGQVISKVGSSGSVTIPQLHFEIRRGKKLYDPRKYLKL
ncbi:MAG: M23 family metallopeptidase [Alphaproteobacteria bacterium]|nr:M23 family metallopeptidase [Rhodospirillales bacterium]MCW9045535.1 M23 family metallopeptidase [Alphaproteobacteria bacterium]